MPNITCDTTAGLVVKNNKCTIPDTKTLVKINFCDSDNLIPIVPKENCISQQDVIPFCDIGEAFIEGRCQKFCDIDKYPDSLQLSTNKSGDFVCTLKNTSKKT